MTTKTYIDTKETAALVRQALKEAFPGVKFSVTISRYSMGSGIYIRWTDGPPFKAVQAVADTFKGDYYDGMTDYHGSVYHLLDGERVSFMGSISTSRAYSKAAETAMLGAWNQLSREEKWALARRLEVVLREHEYDDDYGWRYVMHAYDFYGKPAQPSPTCDRVQVAGDDYRGSFGATPEDIAAEERLADIASGKVVPLFPTTETVQ